MHNSAPQKTGERHIGFGRYLKDIIYASNDGIVTTFAVVAATVGGALSPATILIVGFANLIADGFSMASGNYLGSRSEGDLYAQEELRERLEVRDKPHEEKREIRDILAAKGYGGADLEDMVRLISSREQYWIDFMMREELGLSPPKERRPLKSSAVTFVSFVAAGAIPLLPYIILGRSASFLLAAASTASALFAVGAMRSFLSQRSWIFSGLEMLFIGGSAAAIAYGIGFLLKSIA